MKNNKNNNKDNHSNNTQQWIVKINKWKKKLIMRYKIFDIWYYYYANIN